MAEHCPVCGNPLGRHDIVCPACRQRIDAREPARRHSVLYAWGRGLMLVLAVFLFLKGAFAALSPVEGGDVARSFGLRSASRVTQFLSSAFAVLAALLYAIAWAGGYVERTWDTAVCLAALIVLVVGQALTGILWASGSGQWAHALALFVLWSAVPVLQYVLFRLGQQQTVESGPAAATPDR
jgi:predicted nucleic acid-binding Zn ribbon protein